MHNSLIRLLGTLCIEANPWKFCLCLLPRLQFAPCLDITWFNLTKIWIKSVLMRRLSFNFIFIPDKCLLGTLLPRKTKKSLSTAHYILNCIDYRLGHKEHVVDSGFCAPSIATEVHRTFIIVQRPRSRVIASSKSTRNSMRDAMLFCIYEVRQDGWRVQCVPKALNSWKYRPESAMHIGWTKPDRPIPRKPTKPRFWCKPLIKLEKT